MAQWWTGRPLPGEDAVGGRMEAHFSDGDPAAVFEVLERSPEHLVWRCVEGPKDWRGTRISFALRPRQDGGTTLLFSRGFRAYPDSEISRWD